MNIYWYVSKAKLELLADQAPGFFTGIKAQLGFKLPLLSGSLEGTEPARTEGDLQRVIAKLRAENNIINVADLTATDAPTLVAFEGPAVRQVAHDVFWVAMRQGNVGLLLAGSAASVIGTPAKSDSPLPFHPNYSGDPVGTIREAFDRPQDPDDKNDPIRREDPNYVSPEPTKPLNPKFVRVGYSNTLSKNLTYAWEQLMQESLEGTLPRATGLALFARSVKADPRHLAPLGEAAEGIERIAIGSPIYVQQV